MEAPSHPRQEERLRALRSYEVLDTDPEREFDEIVSLAAAICGTPIALISLVDADRQWFKSELGLGRSETPCTESICAHAILADDFLEIGDTLRDPRTLDNPLCTGEPHLRFYAGAALVTEEGLPLGTLCVLDHEPRQLTPLQRDAVRVLARQVMTQLGMRKVLRTAEMLRKEVDHRVKNSLQSLSSFLRIQARHAPSEAVAQALATVDSRIDAVASLHEQLYRTDAGPSVDLGRYVVNLADRFKELAPSGVVLEVSTDTVAVTSTEAVAVGSLVNEFVANSFKHAFPGDRPGIVRIRIRALGDGSVEVTCSDDGVGLADDNALESGGLGLKIVDVICAELRSELDVQTSPDGVTATIRFQPEIRA